MVEHVAELLASSSPYDVPVPTVLSGSKHKAAARKRSGNGKAQSKPAGPNPGNLAPRGKRRAKPSLSPPLPLRVCRGCGGQLPIDPDRDPPRIEWCPECLHERRRETGASMAAKGRSAADRYEEQTGIRPTHTSKAQAPRAEANARQPEEQRRWSATNDGPVDRTWFEMEIRPRLVRFSLPAIAKATGASTTAASQWRSGRRVPHVRHWASLKDLVQSGP